MNEAETRQELINPTIREAGWNGEECRIPIKDGGIEVTLFKASASEKTSDNLRNNDGTTSEEIRRKDGEMSEKRRNDVGTMSEQVRRRFRAISEELSDVPKRNYELLEANYDDFVAFLASENSDNEKELRRNFGETSEIFSENFGNKGLLLFLVALQPTMSAKDAAPMVGVSARTIETYFSELKKEGIIERIGSARSGKWKIKL